MRQLRLITNFTQLLRPNNKISLCLYLHMHVTDYSIKFPWRHLVLMNFIQLHMLLLRWRKSSFLRTRPGLHFFCLPSGRPCGKTLHEWKDNSVFAKPLAAYTHLSWTVSQLFKPQVQKNRRFHVGLLQPTWSPCDYHAICCTDGKTINACQTPIIWS